MFKFKARHLAWVIILIVLIPFFIWLLGILR